MALVEVLHPLNPWHAAVTRAVDAVDAYAPNPSALLRRLVVYAHGRLRHRPLWDAMQARGWSQRDLCDFLGCTYANGTKMVCLQHIPTSPTIQRRLMELTGWAIDDLFPPVFFQALWNTHRATSRATPRAIRQAWYPEPSPDPATAYQEGELQRVVRGELDTLTPNQRTVLEGYFGLEGPPQTLEALAKTQGKSYERIRQMRDAALRKLSHPAHRARLRPYLEDLDGIRPTWGRMAYLPERDAPAPRPKPPPAPLPKVYTWHRTPWPITQPADLVLQATDVPGWELQRALGPGEHVLGFEVVTFDQEGTGWTTSPATMTQALLFPEMFRVRRRPQPPPPIFTVLPGTLRCLIRWKIHGTPFLPATRERSKQR